MLPDAAALLADAVELAEHHWKVFPLRGKVPAIRKAHPPTLYLYGPCVEMLVSYPNPQRDCKGECGQLGHGLYDGTDDVETVTYWWSGPYEGCNIGCRIPGPVLVIDVDPRKCGLEVWAALLRKYGLFPDCQKTISGRGDGGFHLYVRRPAGKLSTARLGPGIDFKTSTGYAVMPRSIHPDTGRPYMRVDGPIPAPPDWFIELVTIVPSAPRRKQSIAFSGISSADAYDTSVSWEDVLEPHGWVCLDCDPDGEGAHWLHPDATSTCSATIRIVGDRPCLYVYSTNTPFQVTEAGDPHGYTKFRAYAVLNHGGDMSSAGRAIRKGL
jgi:Bifunctional DNA primase/polymerase, N-terminal